MSTAIRDDGLPTLAQALDATAMCRLVAQAARFESDGAGEPILRAEVLSHKRGRRCTLRYTVARAARNSTPSVAIIGKLYRSRRRAARMYERLENLVRLVPRSDGRSSVPAPLMLVEELGLIFQEHVDGQDLRAAAAVGDHGGLAARAGCWLAALHASAPVPGLKVMSVEREVAKAGQWAAEVAPHVTEAAAHRLREACGALRALVGEAHAYRPAMIHKDFYYAHVRWSGTRLSILDFDQLSIGDPAFDVGHFLAHLERHAHRTTGRFDAFATLGAEFLRSYMAHSAVDVRARLPFYRAYTFIKLAATEARRKQGAWQDATRALAEMGCREMQTQGPQVETELCAGRVPWAPVAGAAGDSTRQRGTSTRR